MSAKVIAGAVAADVTIMQTLDPPQRGCTGSAGKQLTIPSDWLARCIAGQTVEGCSYPVIEAGGAMLVSDTAQSRTGNPTYTSGLNAGQLAAFVSKLASAVVVSAVAEVAA